ncbi:unnamed protein product [Peronospora destructor]|uniref:Uncharacterized protein n=1 Tax=Peronospora destructor TaxID=86335 RepID=A0AAV0T4Z8_9STRA|nr:unnamed protein product [Peronospora destructor]
MEALVLKSLVKLRKACTRNHRELRELIGATQAKVTFKSQEGTLEVPFEPFLLACLTRYAKLVVVALDCMEKFLAFGFLKEAWKIPKGGLEMGRVLGRVLIGTRSMKKMTMKTHTDLLTVLLKWRVIAMIIPMKEFKFKC